MLRVLRVLIVVLALGAPEAAAEPITIEDMLDAEDLDAAQSGSAFSPDGKGLAYTVNAARTKRPTWGYDTAQLQTMARVFVTADGGAPREIRGSDDVLYSLVATDAWAPDSGALLLIASGPRSYGLARYDVASGRIRALPGRIYNSFIPSFAWTPDGRLVYATIADDARQARHNAQALEDILARWNATWTGREARVTVHSASPVFAATTQRPGALMLADPRGRNAQAIAEGDYSGNVNGIAVSHSGRRLAAVANREDLANAMMSWIGKRGELQIFALSASGATMVHRLDALDVAAFDKPAWSPSGDSVMVVGRPPNGNSTDSHLYIVEAESGAYRAIDAPGLSFTRPMPDIGAFPVGWLGETPVAVAAHAADGAGNIGMPGLAGSATYEYGQTRNMRADIFAFGAFGPENLTGFAKASVQDFVLTGEAVLAVADGALWTLVPGRAPEKLTANDAPPLLRFGVDIRNPPPAAQTAYYRSGDVERVSLMTIVDGKPKRLIFDLSTRRLAPLDIAGDIVVSAPDRSTVLGRVEDGWASSFVLDDGTPRTLVTVNAGLESRSVAPVEKFTYRIGERTFNGYVLWPPDAPRDAKLPAVVFAYGGTVFGDEPPRSTEPSIDTPIFSGQLLAAEGYAVIYPSTPLGRGSDSDQPQQLADATVAAVDALAAGGRIDTARVGVMGQSFGGFSTAALLSQRSDRFKAGVSLAGLYDFFHAYGARAFATVFSDDTLDTFYSRFVEEGQGQLGRPFWETPDAYIRNSPIFDVATLDSPLLMLHGDLDIGATDLEGAERMYAALLRAGKKPVLVRYWGEGHVAQSAMAIRDQWMRISTWFRRHLKDAP